MKKNRIIPWLTVLLYIASALGMAAHAEEGAEWAEVLSPAAETVAAAPGEPAEQPPQEPSGNDKPQSGERGTPPAAADGAPAEKRQHAPESEQAYRPDEPGQPPAGAEGPDHETSRPFYNVLFINPKGLVLLAYDAAAGTAVEEPPFIPVLKGHTFSHWYQADTDPDAPFHFGAPLEGDVTLAAHFNQTKAAQPQANTPAPGEEAPEGEAPPADEAPEDPEDESPADEDPEDEAPQDEDPEDEADLPPIQVYITSDAGETVRLGDRVTLTAHVPDQPEGEPFSMWRYNAGSGWVVAAENTRTHSFVVSEENHRWMWEFKISVLVAGED